MAAGLSQTKKKYADQLFHAFDKESTGLMTQEAFAKILLLVDPEAEVGEVKQTYDELAAWAKNEGSQDAHSGKSTEEMLDEASGHHKPVIRGNNHCQCRIVPVSRVEPASAGDSDSAALTVVWMVSRRR